MTYPAREATSGSAELPEASVNLPESWANGLFSERILAEHWVKQYKYSLLGDKEYEELFEQLLTELRTIVEIAGKSAETTEGVRVVLREMRTIDKQAYEYFRKSIFGSIWRVASHPDKPQLEKILEQD